MHATIRRYTLNDASPGDVAEAGWQLGIVLAQSAGFVAAVGICDQHSALVTIALFDDERSLIAAEPLAERWKADFCANLQTIGEEVATGVVVSQTGL